MYPPQGSRFQQLVGDWLVWMEHNRGATESTLRCYELHLTRLAKWFATPPATPNMRPDGEEPLFATSEDLQKYTGIFAHSLGITPRARRPMVAAVRGFYKWAAAAGNKHADTNPAVDLPYPSAGIRLPRLPSIAQAERLLMQPDIETFIGLRDAAMLAILMGCGLRLSGLIGLNESSLLWSETDAGESLTLRVEEKGKRERLVPAPREVAMLLRAYLGHADLIGIDRTTGIGDQILFISTRNRTIGPHDYHGERRRIAQRSVRQSIERYAKRAGIPVGSRHPHGLRHLFGTELTESDVPMLTTQILIGHVDPKDTAIYTHLAHRKLREVIDRANPLSKMRAPLLATLRSLDRATTKAHPRVSERPHGAYNPRSEGLQKGKK